MVSADRPKKATLRFGELPPDRKPKRISIKCVALAAQPQPSPVPVDLEAINAPTGKLPSLELAESETPTLKRLPQLEPAETPSSERPTLRLPKPEPVPEGSPTVIIDDSLYTKEPAQTVQRERAPLISALGSLGESKPQSLSGRTTDVVVLFDVEQTLR